MNTSAHEKFMQALRDSFEQAGYNNSELNEIVFDQLNALNQQINELLQLEKKVQIMSALIQELQAKKN